MRMAADRGINLLALARGFRVIAQKIECGFESGVIGVRLIWAEQRHAFQID